jgi:N-formylglutamate amidohydrolase
MVAVVTFGFTVIVVAHSQHTHISSLRKGHRPRLGSKRT